MKALLNTLLLYLVIFNSLNSFAEQSYIDCSEAYEKKSTCKKIACPEKYKSFIGTWEGDFESYDKNLKEFRPYHNIIIYSENDCLENINNNDIFIIGRKIDTYKEFKSKKGFISKGLIITGINKGDYEKPFLKTFDEESGLIEYSKVYTNEPLNLSIWEKYYPSINNNPEMTFTIIDGQDQSYLKSHKRNVFITMKINNKNQIYWNGLLVKGFHIKK